MNQIESPDGTGGASTVDPVEDKWIGRMNCPRGPWLGATDPLPLSAVTGPGPLSVVLVRRAELPLSAVRGLLFVVPTIDAS